MMTSKIKTDRLTLVPLTLEQLQFFLSDLDQLERALGFTISKDHINETVQRAINMKSSKMRQVDAQQHAWLTYWLLVINEASCGAGLIGFKGMPDENGKTEIGYGISSAFGRKGYTTEAARALIDWAFEDEVCQTVVALNVLKTNIGSQRILEKVGMNIFKETGDTLSWRIDKEPSL